MYSARRRLERILANDSILVETAGILCRSPCWVAGGWIRDRALGRTPPDLDLVVAGGPTEAAAAAERLARAFKSKAHHLGRPPRAVWRIQSRAMRAEIWPLTDMTVKEDSVRRDFTCNSMLWRLPEGPLVDPNGGIDDIQARILRAVSRTNLTADPVRLLRGPRFVASLPGFSLDPETASWIRTLGAHLSHAPQERLGAELLTMAHAVRRGEGFELAHDLGLLKHIAPARRYDPNLEALRRLTGEKSHPVPGALRTAGGETTLAWLVKSWNVTSSRDLSPFAWSRTTVQRLLTAANQCENVIKGSLGGPARRREIICHAGPAFPLAFSLAAATDPESDENADAWRRFWRQWLRSGSTILVSRTPVPSSTVAEILDLPPGPELGRALTSLRRAVVRNEVRSASGAVRWLRSYSV